MPRNTDALDPLIALEPHRREAGQVVHTRGLDRLPAHDRVKDRAPQVDVAQAPIRRPYPPVSRPDVDLSANGASVADRRPDPQAFHRRHRTSLDVMGADDLVGVEVGALLHQGDARPLQCKQAGAAHPARLPPTTTTS